MAVPACSRICSWVMFVLSCAMLTSLIWLLDADRFCSVEEIESEVYWRRFCTAPSVAAMLEMLLMARVRLVRADALDRSMTVPPVAALPQLNPRPPRPLLPSMSENVAVRVSPPLAPTWKVTVPVLPAEPFSRLSPLKFEELCWRSISCVSWLTSAWMSVLSVDEFEPLLY